MGVKYLKPGEDFYFPAEFGFKEGATQPRGDSTYVGQRQHFAKGGPAKKGKTEKGDSGDRAAMKTEAMRDAGEPFEPKPDQSPDETVHSVEQESFARGGPQHLQPETAPREPTISMPLSQAAQTAAHLVHMGAQHGAQTAVRNIAAGIQARRQAAPPGAPPMASPGPPAGPGLGVPPPRPPAGAPPGGPPMMAGGGHLTAEQRHHMPSSSFALPGERYPINDPSHARNALSRVSQNGSPGEKAKVRSAVHRKYPNIGKD